MEIEQKTFDLVAEVLGVGFDAVRATANFNDDLGADSLDLIELIVDVEDDFAIEISDEACAKIITVGDLVDCIRAAGKKGGL
ncbi:MAG: acyl carrier protein [Desulfobulbales bacterium]|nr:acyl carrier protein [Desulfobulbales bacterium]